MLFTVNKNGYSSEETVILKGSESHQGKDAQAVKLWFSKVLKQVPNMKYGSSLIEIKTTHMLKDRHMHK